MLRPQPSRPERSAPRASARPIETSPARQCAFDFAEVSPSIGPTCRRCNSPVPIDPVEPGPGLGTFCRPCFVAWDTELEALELEFARVSFLPDPELDADTPDRQAA